MKDDLTQKVSFQLESLQQKMKKTITEEEQRGQSIQQLNAQTDDLEQRAEIFEQVSEETKWRIWLRTVKWYAIIGGVILIIICGIWFLAK